MKPKKVWNAMYVVGAVAGFAAVAFWGANRGMADDKEKGAEKEAGHEDHDHEKKAGPNGGRIIHSVEPHLEFAVMEDGKVRISALDDDNKVAAMGDQLVTFVGGDRTKQTRLSFVKVDGYLESDGVLPEGKSFPVVLQIKVDADAKAVLERFQLDLSECPTCDYLEYACICDHEHEEGADGEK